MVYRIYDGDKKYCLFDIEFYSKTDENLDEAGISECWHLELHSHAFISGAINFIKNTLKETEKEDFFADCRDIEELRGWLWERHDNGLVNHDTIFKRNSAVNAELSPIIYGFANKWGLKVDTD